MQRRPILEFRGEFDFLSNFYRTPVEFEGFEYPTLEHAFHAAKSSDPDYRRQIQSAVTPARAKAFGRTGCKLPVRWNTIRLDVMDKLVRQKFRFGTDMATRLLATQDAYLEEGNTWNDTFWGVCRGEGENQLGRILMRVRDELRSGGSRG